MLSLPAVALVVAGFCVPLGILLAYSFWPNRGVDVAVGEWTLANYGRFFDDPVYWLTLLRSFGFVGIAAVSTVLIGCPFAYYVALRVPPRFRMWWVVAAVLPFSASYLIRIFAWLNLFGDTGLLNAALTRLGLISGPLGVFEYGKPAIVITFAYLLFPLAFLTTFVAIERIDVDILESAADLGARPWQALLRVVLPIARTGLFAGVAFCFVSMMGDYVTPTLMGGTQGTLFANFVVTKFGFSGQWGFGSALAFILLASMLVLLVLARRATGAPLAVGRFARRYTYRRSLALRGYSWFVMAIIYLPIALLVLFAFNSSDLIGLPISGFTLSWFAAVFQDPALISAWQTSLTVVAVALPVSLVLGTSAAVRFARTRGRWRSLSLGVLALPVFLPPVMLGLGLIISLNAIGVTRGLWTIMLAHTLLILPIVVFLVLTRLEGVDANLEDAAMDLGARPWRVLLSVTVPQAFPAIVAAALVGFAISLDEFVVTYLVTGHDVTLPLFIYSSLHYAPTPELNALSSLMLALSFLFGVLAVAVLRGWGRLRRRVSRG